MVKSLITCDCGGSFDIDAAALSQATGLEVKAPCTALCTTQITKAAEAISAGDVAICCTQQQVIFDALAEELDAEPVPLLDLRDRGGWSDDPAPNTPKMAALIAEAMLPAPSQKTLDVVSEGMCLITGPAEVALAAGEALKSYLSVTVLLTQADDVPAMADFDVIVGQLRRAQGALGQFELRIDALQQVDPVGRGTTLTPPRDGATSQCDILLDLTGGTPLFPAPEKREGYLRADPTHAPAVAAATLAASHLVGTFEQPLYVRSEPLLCAHSRAEQTGCTRCLDLCPTGAIVPDGEHVKIDPMACAGCGACSAVCPSGAISYDAPPVSQVFTQIQTLASSYSRAGGTAPRLLVVPAHGMDMIRLSARHGRGLPADVIPLEMAALNAFGHAEMVAAHAAGFTDITILPGPRADTGALDAQVMLARAILGDATVRICDTEDPDILSDTLFEGTQTTAPETPVRPMGTRRQITRQAARALHGDTQIPLPEGAPYGAIVVNTDACTLCLSCVSLCPSGALGDNPDNPQLRFQEDACLQCGICSSACPENAITLEPRLDLSDAALQQRVLHEEEPFACIDCGSLFGVKSTVERITEKLQGHSMFDGDKLRMIQMCDDCRVRAQAHSQNNPFEGKARPKPRSSDDYLSKRRDH